MASSIQENRMAAELLQIVRDSRYNPTITPLRDDDKVTKKQFSSHRLCEKLRLDTRHNTKNRRVNHNSMYEIFSRWSLDEADELKALIIDKIKTDYAYYSRVSLLWTKLKGTTFNEWLYHVRGPNVGADELMLFILCREFDRHCVVFTKTRTWSTIQSETPINENDLISRCDLLLLYMGKTLLDCYNVVTAAQTQGCNTV